jgi:hypothetical protein
VSCAVAIQEGIASRAERLMSPSDFNFETLPSIGDRRSSGG